MDEIVVTSDARLREGMGCPQKTADQKKAEKESMESRTVQWLKQQSESGARLPNVVLGIRYLNGQGVETNNVMAIELLNKSATQGNIEASNMLLKLSMTVQAQASK